jgi:hypothetical protein
MRRRTWLKSGIGLLGIRLNAQERRNFQTAELQGGELTLLLGNEYDHGSGRSGYIGIWSLTSVHEPTNVFVPHYAGWIHRRNRAEVTRVSATEGFIQHVNADGTAGTRQTFKVVAPFYFDCVFTLRAAGNPAWIGASSYMNGPEDPGIYFINPDMKWQRHYDPIHGNAASILPVGMAVPEVKKSADSQYAGGAVSFSDTFAEHRYHPDYPLFYGRFRDMVLVHMFPPRSDVIPYTSPRGGGLRPDGKTRNPAWDWRATITRGVQPNAVVNFTMRAVYKKFVDEADVLGEYRRWTNSLSSIG